MRTELLRTTILAAIILLTGCSVFMSKGPDFTISDYGGEYCYDPYEYEWKGYECESKRDYKKAFLAEGMTTAWKYYEPHITPEIRMYAKDKPYCVPIGTSKWGGHPDLPLRIQWPNSSLDAAFTLVAQVNLEELHKVRHEDNLLPKTGMLYFGYAIAADTCWLYTKPNCFKVFYLDTKVEDLVRKPTNGKTYPATAIKFEEGYGFQKENNIKLESFANEAEECAYEGDHFGAQWRDILYPENRLSKMFGYLDDVQGDMTPSCAREKGGEVEDWILLLQMDSQSESRMMWQDVGRIFFLIKREDLLNLNFDNLCIDLDGH